MKIKCYKCQKNLGEIREATLSKGINFLCTTCKNKLESISDKCPPNDHDNGFYNKNKSRDLFNGLFNLKK